MPPEPSAAEEVGVEGAGVDLDAVLPAPPPPPPDPRRRRRARAAAAVVAVLLVAGLALAQRVERDRAATVELVATSADLLAVQRPSSADNNTRVSVGVQLRNDGPSALTVRSVRTGGVGALLRDDLRSSGSESLGLEQGTRLEPGGAAGVPLSGVLRCPGPSEPAAVGGDLVVEVTTADGRQRQLDVAAPPGVAWSEAFARACSLGPAVGDGEQRSALRLDVPA